MRPAAHRKDILIVEERHGHDKSFGLACKLKRNGLNISHTEYSLCPNEGAPPDSQPERSASSLAWLTESGYPRLALGPEQ